MYQALSEEADRVTRPLRVVTLEISSSDEDEEPSDEVEEEPSTFMERMAKYGDCSELGIPRKRPFPSGVPINPSTKKRCREREGIIAWEQLVVEMNRAANPSDVEATSHGMYILIL
jgi:hypothetical protein